MPATAFSVRFERELDVDQLAILMTGTKPTQDRDGAELLSVYGDAIRADVQCSSCGKFGAHIVRPAKSRASKAVLRQAHFRFVDPNGGDAHHPFCEFHGNDETRSTQDSLLTSDRKKALKQEPYGSWYARASNKAYLTNVVSETCGSGSSISNPPPA